MITTQYLPYTVTAILAIASITLSMIEIGHSASEEGGSEFVKKWLNEHMPRLPVHHIPSGNSLQIF